MEGAEKERWRQFCTQYAKSVAFKFAESWRQYTSNPEHLGHIHVLTVDVVEHFSKTLHDELLERLNASSAANSLQSSTHQQAVAQVGATLPVGAACAAVNYRESGVGWRSLNECGRAGSSQDTTNWMAMTRSRSELSSLSRTSNTQLDSPTVQQHQPSSSLGISTSSSKRLSWFRSRFPAKTAVELIKEGNVRYMSGLELETKHWRKCRLCLVKTAGGYLLEFYSPPKSNRAKSGIFCFLIMEARETTPLEFEDSNESIFAIRAFNGVEYVIEARNHEDCQQWLTVIRESIPGVEMNLPEQRPARQPSAPPIARTDFARTRRFPSTRSLNNVHAMTSSFCVDARIPVTMRAFPPGLDIYPWFHARLSRGVSSRLVLHNGADGHGLFLVRQSETRPGEFVLTFNCQGKAKHVRIVVMPDGECRIHQMIFDTMIDLLEHFRDNPIPLENSSHPPMFLNEYVICWRRRSMALTEVDVRDFLTYAGSVRLDIRELERVVLREHENRQRRALTRTNSNSYHFF
uniref:SH2B adapter protein 2 n=2 Tax=Ascaris TaxID=6251 RepID=F1L0Q9_ASCSU